MLTFFTRLSIRTKLMAAFGVLLLITSGLGAFTTTRMKGMNDAITDTNYFPSITHAGEMRSLLEKFRIAEARFAMATDPARQAQAEADMNRIAAAYATERKKFDDFIDPGEQTDRYNQIGALWAEYLKTRRPMEDAAQRHDQAAAIALWEGKLRDIFAKISDLFDKDIDYNSDHGLASGNHEEMLYRNTKNDTYAVVGLAVVITLCLGLSLIRGISTPIRHITNAMRRLAERDMQVQIPGAGRGDEIGDMAAAVQFFKENMIRADSMAAEQEANKLATAQKAALNGIADAFEKTVGGLLAALGTRATDMQATAQHMSATATQTGRQASSVAAASDEASASVQSVALAAEKLTASIQEITRQVAQSANVTRKAVEDARLTDNIVRTLAEGAQKIGDVVQLITNIAAQTNLLALNATIEAARAGDAGKGFAVVANEVKVLANQTAKATQDISEQIAHIQQATEQTVQAIKGIGATIGEVSDIAATIASAIDEQGSATADIAHNVARTAARTRDVSAIITGVSQTANDTGEAAGEVLTAAQNLSRQADDLSAEVNRFVSGVRAA